MTVTRIADNTGSASFADTMYREGNASRGKTLRVSIVASSVQLACNGTILRVHPIRNDPARNTVVSRPRTAAPGSLG